MTLYRVTGKAPYRDHPPDTTFEADLLDAEERRAVERGAIAILKRERLAVDPAKAHPPHKWPS